MLICALLFRLLWHAKQFRVGCAAQKLLISFEFDVQVVANICFPLGAHGATRTSAIPIKTKQPHLETFYFICFISF